MKNEIEQILKKAYLMLNSKRAILAPKSEAVVTFPDFDPCRPVQVIARVDWPATVNMRNVTLTHFVMDGDAI